MNAISNVLTLAISEAKTETHPLRTIALFCCLGLVASLGVATMGIDMGAYLY